MGLEDVIALAVVVLVVGGALAFLVKSLRTLKAVQNRGEVLLPLGQKLGFRFMDREVDDNTAESPVAGTLFRTLFGDPGFRLQGAADGLSLDLYESAYLGGGRNPHQKTQACFVFTAKGKRWPCFLLRPECAAPEPKELDDLLGKLENVDLELEDFEAAYTVAARSLDEVRALFGPRLVSELLLLVTEGQAMTVESLGNRLFLWREEETVPAERLEQLLGLARRVRQMFDEAAADAERRSRPA